MRLSKFLAHAGYCSRREAEKIIKDDKVIINNVICNDFSYQVDEKDMFILVILILSVKVKLNYIY